MVLWCNQHQTWVPVIFLYYFQMKVYGCFGFFLIYGVSAAATSNLHPKATQPRSSSDELLWKVILYHPLTVH